MAAVVLVCPSAKNKIPSPIANAEIALVTLSRFVYPDSNAPIAIDAPLVAIIMPSSAGQPANKPKAAPANPISLKVCVKNA